MRPWKPSPQTPPSTLVSAVLGRKRPRGFSSFLYGGSVLSRRARPFAASGAPCLTLDVRAQSFVFYDHVRPDRPPRPAVPPPASARGLLAYKCVVGEPEASRSLRRNRDALPPRDTEGGAPLSLGYRLSSGFLTLRTGEAREPGRPTSCGPCRARLSGEREPGSLFRFSSTASRTLFRVPA